MYLTVGDLVKELQRYDQHERVFVRSSIVREEADELCWFSLDKVTPECHHGKLSIVIDATED